MSLRMRSSVWLFFDKTSDPSTARCSLCGTCIKAHSSTTNLLKHLRAKHFDETSAEIHWDNSVTENMENTVSDPNASDFTDLTEAQTAEGDSSEMNMSVDVIDSLVSSAPSIRSNRSPVWYCFTRSKDSNVAQCKFCHVSLRYDKTGGTSGLLNHFMRKHDKIYVQVMAELSKDGSDEVQGTAEEYEEPEYVEFKGCLDPNDQSAEMSTDMQALLQEANDDLAAVVAEAALNHLTGQTTDRRKSTRSLAWACFTRIADSDVAVCKFCRMVVKTESGSTSNMLNHFQRRHSREYEQAKARRQSGVEESSEQHADGMASEDFADPDGSSQDDGQSLELTASELTERTNKSIVWSCFSKSSDGCETGFHECIHCGAHLRSDQGSTSSMLAHFMKKHPAEYRIAISSRSAKSDTKSNLIRKHFIQLTSDDWSCCFCQRLLRQPGSSVSNLVKHLMKKHNEEYKIIFNESNLHMKTVRVKTEHIEDSNDVVDESEESQSNGTLLDSSEFSEQPTKRQKLSSPTTKGTTENPLSKMAALWRRHCQERQKEHDRQISVMKEKLASLQESMKKIKDEVTSVQGEINRTEDAWRKETTRQKEVNRQFQNALKQAESGISGRAMTESTNDTASAGTLAMHVDDSDWMAEKSF